MSILSDSTILARISAGDLVINGDARHVEFCSYQFTPEKVLEPGADGRVLDWKACPDNASYSIRPGQLVWVRTRGEVTIPSDMCAFYWQTNTLARVGLMLVNSSMVEPGYKGPLACLFANFGKQDIVINPRTKVAKIIFLQLDQPALRPSSLSFEATQYDDTLRQVAAAAPRSFLQIADFATSLAAERDKAINDIQKGAADAREKELEGLKSDHMKAIRSAFGWAVLGLLVLTVAITLAQNLQNRLRPNATAEIQAEVATAVRRSLAVERATVLPSRDSAETAITMRLNNLQRQVDSLSRLVRR